MDLDELRIKWTTKYDDKKAAADMWDSMAGQFKDYEIPGYENRMIKLIEEENMIPSGSRILDVGCGTGRYSAALAENALSVTGIDLSPKMIGFGKENMDRLHIKNVNLICSDWRRFDILENGYEKKFDLVFAHMTPAVSDAFTFEKMIQCSRSYGIMCKPTRRTDEISDEIMKMVGVNKHDLDRDESIMYAFSMLWLMGYNPKLGYEEQEWNHKKTFEEACGMYINRVKTHKSLRDHDEEKIKHFLSSKLHDGFIEEKVKTTVTTLYWKKD